MRGAKKSNDADFFLATMHPINPRAKCQPSFPVTAQNGIAIPQFKIRLKR
jgi:hypothetical protein